MLAKFTKFTEVCKNKFSKLEHEKAENNIAIEKKCATMQKDIGELRKEQGSLCDDVSKIETERDLVTKKIEIIDDVLEKINEHIENS